MRQRTPVLLLLLLVLHLTNAHRTNDNRHVEREVSPRRHDNEDRASGRRWTTSRNSPYQKIVSSYEQEVPQGDSGSPEDEDQAKAKSHKRKQWRTNAPSHDQITSETSSDGESEKDEHEHVSESSGKSEPYRPEVTRSSAGSSRRRSTTIHPRETNSGLDHEISTSNPKKRRRIPNVSTTTPTHSPQTMSDSLYQHFQPLDQNVPQDDIIPFLDFGRKLSPVVPTPSGANSIDNKSTVTKLRPRIHHEEKESNTSDEEMLQEDMDVTVVKKAIERNSVPRAKLRVREQGISDYYRKRVPIQVRTTENLISTSDSSTAPTIPGTKNIVLLKKGNRHHVHHTQLVKVQEQNSQTADLDIINLHQPSNGETLQNKVPDILLRPVKKSAALTEEAHHSPLTAESSVVKTIIKDVPTTERSSERLLRNHSTTTVQTTSTAVQSTEKTNLVDDKPSSAPTGREIANNGTKENQNGKILSTAVVTSVSIQESLKDIEPRVLSESTSEVNSKTNTQSSQLVPNVTAVDQLLVSAEPNKSAVEIPVRNIVSSTNSTNALSTNTSKLSTNTTSLEPKIISIRNETSLRSRDIYRPKAIPPGLNIHHLPRQIPFNITRKSNSPHNIVSSGVTFNFTAKNNATATPSTTANIVPSTTPSTTTNMVPSTTASTSLEASTTTTTITVNNPSTTSSSTNTTSTFPSATSSYKRLITTTKAGNNAPEHNLGNKLSLSTTTEPVKVETPFEVEKQSSISSLPPLMTVDSDKSSHSVEDDHSSFVETESVPPPKYDEPVDNLTFIPVSANEDPDDQFPIYFTTLPTAKTTVTITRPRADAEVALVQEHRNITTQRSGIAVGADWVKIGAVDKEVEVIYPEALGMGAYLLAGLGVVPIVLGALVGARFILAHNRKKVLDESEYSSEYNRSPLGASTASPLPTKLPRIPTHVGWSETEKNTPTIAPVPTTPGAVRWEFPRDKLRLQTLLGQGNFGQVWKAEADDISGHEGLTRLVAVKTVKESANAREREDLLRELGIMQELGSHPNVVTLLGCCTEKEPIYLIMEYVMYGKLLSFLRDRRTRSHYYNFSDATDALTSRDLTVFGYCVARGMDYLTNKSIIHRDLAARNVLVDHNKLCKIADFGMSRNVRDTGQIYEQRQSKGALPIRWMAPESLHFSLFTAKTDVWSFGILMWEIVTLGSTPYATMGAREVMRRVRDGYRLDRPSHCRPELFRLIAQCWHSEPSRRPSFAELKTELAQLLSDKDHNGSYVDLESYADEMRRDSLHRHH